MAESAAELVVEPNLSMVEPPPALSWSNGSCPATAEELVAKCIAPVKREFLLPPPSRIIQNDAAVSDSDANAKTSQSSVVPKEKKSKRQLKRERRQKSALHLCPEIAKTCDVSSCTYGDRCRFSHDVEAFKAQKPADLEGECPFASGGQLCPYGLACRFYGMHKDNDVLANGSEMEKKSSSEMNGLNKDVQKLLWKNKMKFPKADATLKSLGLMLMGKSKVKKLDEEEVDQILEKAG
uniref:tRNA-dihydrouridine(47) synthase [NAD(P)(+)] n=1 Tax=Rhizophora mucronata TaxID=61149 RepID=A0A2P2L4K8_RHIMU